MDTFGEDKFRFKSVELFKERVLGIGAYGKVCEALCDFLPCAAKIMHETLFDPSLNKKIESVHEHRLPFSRFKQECELLSVVKHPNIVQYLGMYCDPDLHLPVLLMELMDCSLTQFVDGYKGAVPFHLQVNICLDVALALFYLHSNGLIHRDLSGNNVLMLGSARAKVTDFGMARLVDPQRLSVVTRTVCPGTDVYMPPEALDDPPTYTEKMDCFSLGVIMVQILSQRFPSPTARKKKVKIENPGLLEGVMVDVPVPEVERRQEHIKKINSSHPLLSAMIKCLVNKSADRPSSEQLCKWFSELKRSQAYKESKKAAASINVKASSGDSDTPSEIAAGKIEDVPDSQEKEKELKLVKEKLEESQLVIDDLHKRIEELELLKKRPTFQFTWKGTRKAPCEMFCGADAVVSGSVAYIRPAGTRAMYAYDVTCSKWEELPEYPNDKCSLVMVDDILTIVGGTRDGRTTNQLLSLIGEGKQKKWVGHFPPMPTRRCRVGVVYVQETIVVVGGVIDGNIACNTVEVMDIDRRVWTAATCLPEALYRLSATVCNDSIYLLGGFDKNHLAVRCVLACPVRSLLRQKVPNAAIYTTPTQWNKLTDLSVTQSTCVTFRDQLLVVGGMDIGRKHNRIADIRTYDPLGRQWEVVGHMSTPRRRCFAAVLMDEYLMIIGGMADDGRSGMDAFEIATVSVC